MSDTDPGKCYMELRVTEEEPDVKCDFCHRCDIEERKYGGMYRLDGITTHYFCILLSSTLYPRGKEYEGIFRYRTVDIYRELEKGDNMVCVYCKTAGGTIKCFKKDCQTNFHFPCAKENGSHHKFMGNFASFCPSHRPAYVRRAPKYVTLQESWACDICGCSVNVEDQVWPVCCNLGVFDRECIEKAALAAGRHHLKCPLCGNKNRFLQSVEKVAGIFVPNRDASWETELGAIEDPSIKLSCAAERDCKCPNGISFDPKDNGSEWKFVKCYGCGGLSVHLRCGGYVDNSKWRCLTCLPLVSDEKVKEIENKILNETREREPASSRHLLQLSDASQTSDSDIHPALQTEPGSVYDRKYFLRQKYFSWITYQ